MSDYLGPFEDIEEVQEFLLIDSLPSVQIYTTLDDLKKSLQTQLKTIVLGFFPEVNGIIEDDQSESFIISPWGQYLASADSLRG